MYNKADHQAAVDSKKEELLMVYRLNCKVARDEAIVCLCANGYFYAEAARLLDLIENGKIANISINCGEKNDAP